MAKELDLGKDPIPGLVLAIAIPASIGFFFNTMFNIVDTYWAGVLSTEAQAALALSFPVFFLIIASGSGIGTATTVLSSHSHGARRPEDASRYGCQGISFAVFASALLTIIGLLSSPFLFTLLGANGTYLSSSLAFMNVMFLGTVFFMMNFVLNAILNSRGDTKSFRNALIVGFFLNVAADPLFMLGYGPVPRMGVAGLSFATVAIEFLVMLYLAVKVKRSGTLAGKSLRDFMPNYRVFSEIAGQGFPASLNMLTVAIGIFVITYFIGRFGEAAVAAYGISTRIEQIALLPTIGLNIATLSIVGYNFGARQFSRIKEAYSVSLKYGCGLITLGTVLVFLFPGTLVGFFSQDPKVVELAVPYLRIAAFIFWAYVILFLTVSLLQGVKRPMFGIWIGLYRQIIAPLAVFTFLSQVIGLGLMGVYVGIFVVNWSAVAISLWYAHSVLRNLHITM